MDLHYDTIWSKTKKKERKKETQIKFSDWSDTWGHHTKKTRQDFYCQAALHCLNETTE